MLGFELREIERRHVGYACAQRVAKRGGQLHDEMLAQMDRVLVEGGYLKKGELVVFVAGQPVGRPGSTNLMKLHRLGVG